MQQSKILAKCCDDDDPKKYLKPNLAKILNMKIKLRIDHCIFIFGYIFEPFI
jgi:hypothetical protein